MSLNLLAKSRWLVAMLGLAAATSFGGCAMDTQPIDDEEEGVGVEAASTDAITNVDHTKVKRQSIGNCWLYATASWLEALHKTATGEEKNVSESYLTYWHWFDQIANGAARDEVSTGGSYGVAAELVTRYGLMLEGDFIPAEAEAEMSNRQASALNAINASLKSGALKDPAARRNRETVRRELDKAWGLDKTVQSLLTNTFGWSVSRTIDKSYVSKRTPTKGKILRAKDFTVQVKDATGEWRKGTAADVIGTRGYSTWAPRQGALAWKEVDYPSTPKARRELLKRVQRALHDGQPVIISWFVDFNALSSESTFSLEELARRGGPGSQGGHMTVLHDYEIDGVPGFGTLPAGVEETRPEALAAALADEAEIKFLRIKNSWGGYRPDRWNDAVLPGYHDLTMGYLNGPVKKCSEGSATSCYDHTPLWEVVLPAGY